MGRFREIIGTIPIPAPLLIFGKIAYLGCVLFPFARIWGVPPLLFAGPVTDAAGFFLYGAGLVVVVASLIYLREAAVVGLPLGETRLRTGGLYRYTRNPVYVGADIVCLGSVLAAPHVVNALCFAVAVVIHGRIIAREEEFLEGRFGDAWRDYKRRVPRYLGIPRQTPRSTGTSGV